MRIKRVTSDVGDKIAGMAMWMLVTGVLLAIWGGVWAFYLFQNPTDREMMYFFAAGIFLTGLDLVLVSQLSGKIGRIAREQVHRDDEVSQIAVTTPRDDDHKD